MHLDNIWYTKYIVHNKIIVNIELYHFLIIIRSSILSVEIFLTGIITNG